MKACLNLIMLTVAASLAMTAAAVPFKTVCRADQFVLCYDDPPDEYLKLKKGSQRLVLEEVVYYERYEATSGGLVFRMDSQVLEVDGQDLQLECSASAGMCWGWNW